MGPSAESTTTHLHLGDTTAPSRRGTYQAHVAHDRLGDGLVERVLAELLREVRHGGSFCAARVDRRRRREC